MEHYKEVIIYNVPKSVTEKDLLSAVEQIVGKDRIKQSIPLPLPNNNNFSNYRLSFDSEDFGLFLYIYTLYFCNLLIY